MAHSRVAGAGLVALFESAPCSKGAPETSANRSLKASREKFTAAMEVGKASENDGVYAAKCGLKQRQGPNN